MNNTQQTRTMVVPPTYRLFSANSGPVYTANRVPLGTVVVLDGLWKVTGSMLKTVGSRMLVNIDLVQNLEGSNL